jgi:predicted DNA-binding protein
MRSIKRSVDLSPETYEALQRLAAVESVTVSELIRKYIEQGMNVDKVKHDMDFIRRQFREEIKIQMKAQIERLIKLIIKIGMIDLTAFFYMKEILKLTNPALEKELWDTSHKNVAGYMGMKNIQAVDEAVREFNENCGIDDYIREGETE